MVQNGAGDNMKDLYDYLQIPEGSLVCYPCWLRVVRIIQNQENPQSSTQSSDSANVCVWCQASLGQRRSHALNESPERNLIASIISPREVNIVIISLPHERYFYLQKLIMFDLLIDINVHTCSFRFLMEAEYAMHAG